LGYVKHGARHEVTRLRHEWGRGDRVALDALMPLVHAELHAVARRYFERERPPARPRADSERDASGDSLHNN
jgi:hypothetical protein